MRISDGVQTCALPILALACVRITDDHRLAAAKLESGQRGFQRHPARQAQHIAQGIVVIGVGKHPAATERKSVVSGKSVSVRVDLGGRRNIKKKINTEKNKIDNTKKTRM